MNIKVWLPKRYGGTGLYRLRMPHELLDEDVVFTDSVNLNDLLCDLLIVSKSYIGSIWPIWDVLRRKGVKIITDFDDYWSLPQEHILYKRYQKHNSTELLAEVLRKSDYIISATDLLAVEIRKINKNVITLYNAINPVLVQFKPEPEPSSIVRFGWIGGPCHLQDIKLLEYTPEKLKSVSENWNIYLFGHDGSEESVYNEFARILSGNMKTVDKLKIYGVASADTYTKYYNLIDIALAPLCNTKFNSMKSELKMVEAAFFKKGLIVSNVMPYKQWATDKNCLVCDNKQDWFKNMMRIIKNPNLAKDLGEQLYDDLHERFDIRNVNKRRIEWYRSIV